MSVHHQSTADTLRILETTEANLEKADRLWKQLRQSIPDGISFGASAEYDTLCRKFGDVMAALPAIEGFRPEARPLALNQIAQWRLDAMELGEVEAQVACEEAIDEPEGVLAEYRYRFDRKRRALIRTAVTALIQDIDNAIGSIAEPAEESGRTERAPEQLLTTLRDLFSQLDTLLGSSVARPARWSDLRRHLHFGMRGDLDDVQHLDWPSVKPSLESSLYGADEAIPVAIADLGELASPHPHVPVPTALNWRRLPADEFERLVFSLLTRDASYENVQWLMNTTAADRGRDLSAFRVLTDALSGTRRERVIVQCKHWTARSIGVADVAGLREQMRLWEPPRVDVLVIATSGRFSADAVQYIERHNQSELALRVEMWPGSHLELLLAARPALIGEFNLRT